MGDPIWTHLRVGGRITKDKIDAIVERINEDFDERPTMGGDNFLHWSGNQNLGKVEEEILDLLTAHELTWETQWEGVGGVCEAGKTFWKPGMTVPKDADCDADGSPVVNLTQLKQHAEEGKSIWIVIALLEENDIVIPPIEVIPRASASSSS